ncbi:MAG: hypothetical protein WD080_03270 [Egibacteraceae bacterium]
MAGALTERVFVEKMDRIGFTGIVVLGRAPFSLDDAGLYPLFTPDLIDLMRTRLPAARHDEVARALTVVAHKPA